MGVVHLVGAGPGDPGLLTRRAIELLATADVVVYDRLVGPLIAGSLPVLAPSARLIDVGKSPGRHATPQSEINAILVDEGRTSRVVRLKGGDPFIFGRGGEECEALAAAGVPYEVVPGVTSAIAGPAAAGIPITHREAGSWAVIAAGHTADPESHDWDVMAAAPTAVFLMGVTRMPDIVAALMKHGRAPDTPAAVIASATLPDQRTVVSTLDRIVEDASGVPAPAVLVIGEVVRLSSLQRGPLHGKRIFVTRTRAQASALTRLLREQGAVPLEFPVIRIEPPTDDRPLRAALGRLFDYDWLVFTSANAVDAVLDRIGDVRLLSAVSIAVVGTATAERLRAARIMPDLMPETFTAESLAAQFLEAGRGHLLLPRGEDDPGDLAASLESMGWQVTEADAYRKEREVSSLEPGRDAIEAGVDAVLFTSGSTVREFYGMWGRPPADALVVCIGPQTAAVAQERIGRVDAVANPHTVDGLVEALIEALARGG